MRTRKIAQLIKTTISIGAVAALGLGMTGCSSSADTSANSKEVTLVTHNDFALPKDLTKKFEKDTGLKLKIVQADSGAMLVNKLKMTKDAPIGDVVFGIATNDMGKVAKEGLLDDVDVTLPKGAAAFRDDAAPNAIPVDRGDLCVNYDVGYFKDKGIPAPKTFDDLTKPQYKDMFVTINASKVTGFGFLAATIAKYGEDGWQDYWKKLMANGAKIDPGWSEAYNQDFTQGEGKGKYPIVVSYASSPAFTVNKEGTASSTAAMLDTCYQQVEYAGVLKNAKNPQGAKKVIEWLTSPQVQAAIPDSMYMLPIDSTVKLPDEYKFVDIPKKSLLLPSTKVADNQEKWVKTWTDDVAK